MKKIPSYLKGLAERQARAAGEVIRLQRLQAEIATELEQHQSVLASCAMLIRDFDAALDPDLIEPIRATKGRYGGYGALRDTIRAALKLAAPHPMSTRDLSLYVQAKLRLDFAGRREYQRWFHNTLGGALKQMRASGEVVRAPDLDDPHDKAGRWQWPTECSTLDGLREQATASGVAIADAAEASQDEC